MKKIYRQFIVICITCLFSGIYLSLYNDSSALNISYDMNTDFITDLESETDFPSTGYFYAADKDGIWWLVTPEGEKFYSIGISFVEPGDFFYENISQWTNKTRDRLFDWGFNTLNGGDTHIFNDMYYILKISLKQIVKEDGWTHRRIPDVFDTGWQDEVRIFINNTADLLRNDSNLIGYQTDNEMKWGPDVVDDDTLVEVYMAADETTAGKKKLVEFFKLRYGDNIEDFNCEWKMNIDDFDDLFDYKKFGVRGWRIRDGRAKEDLVDFSRLIAKTYFSFINSTLKKADPNHLNLGVRFFLQGVPREVLEECGRYVDVISVNYYRMNIFTYDPLNYFYSRLYDCVTLEDWMYNYYDITGKPLLSSEYTFPGKDSIWPILPKAEMAFRNLVPSSGKSAYTQKGRADLFEWYSKNCFNTPYMVGHTWFKYRDKLNIVNWGLVNLWDEPYEILVNRMSEINNKAIDFHENSLSISLDRYADKTGFDFFSSSPKFDFLFEDDLNYFEKQKKYNSFYDLEDKKIDFSLDEYGNIDYNNVLYVGGEGLGNYSKIQHAIDNSSNGDKIFVYNGIYNESLKIDKSIALYGEDKNNTIIIGNYYVEDVDDEIEVITISADDVFLFGFTITASGGYFHDYFLRTCSGIFIDKCDNITIIGNVLKDLGSFGIRIRQSDNNKIIGNIIYNVLNKKGSCVFIDSANYSVIENNYLYHSTICCIWISRCIGTNILNNTISDSYYSGIILETSDDNYIFNNVIKENSYAGLLLKNSNDNIISSNDFYKVIHYRQGFFFNSFNNVWDGNYWGYNKILPKIIYGKYGEYGFAPAFNFDWNPANRPYEAN